MSGYAGPDDESLHAIIMAENEERRVRDLLAKQALRESAYECEDCDDEIPEVRRKAVPGTQLCTECASIREQKTGPVVRQKMVEFML